MNKTIPAHIAIIGANVIYGVNFSVAKMVMPDYLGSYGFTTLRIIGASILFWAISFLGKREQVEPKDYKHLFIASVLGVFINQFAFFKGLSMTTPINASIIMTLNPVVVLIMASIVLNTKITLQKTIGIGLGLTGAVFIISQGGKIDFSSDTLQGNFLVFVNAIVFSCYMIYVKRLMEKYQPMTVLRWMFLFGWLTVVPIGTPEILQTDWLNMPLYVYLSIGFVIVFTTVLTYLFINYGIKHAGPTVVSTYVYLQPVVASLVAIGLGKDELNRVKVLSALFVFVGVYLVSSPSIIRAKRAS